MATCNELLLDSRGVSAEEEREFFLDLWHQFTRVLAIAQREPKHFSSALLVHEHNLARSSKGGQAFLDRLREGVKALEAGGRFDWEPLIKDYFKIKVHFEDICRSLLEIRDKQSSDWHKDLVKAINELEEQRNSFLTKNLRLVINFLGTYASIPSHLLAPDIIQHGNIGLLNAIERFNPWAGVRFSTYASWWIHHKIRRALENEGRSIRLPNREVKEAYKKDKREQANFNNDEEVTPDESLEDVILTRLYKGQIIQLDAPIPRMDGLPDSTILQTFEERAVPDGYEFTVWQELRASINKAINYLDERGKYILVKRFGLDEANPEPLSKIGQDLQLSRERIRQLEAKALKKIGRILKDHTP